MFLVDTSVWIDYFNQTHTPATAKFEVRWSGGFSRPAVGAPQFEWGG